jgi:hypothetical protein
MSRFLPKPKKKDKDFSEFYKLESNIKVTFEDSDEITTMSEERRKAFNSKGMNIQPIITPSIIIANAAAMKATFDAKQAALDAKNKEAEDIRALRLASAKTKADTKNKEKTQIESEIETKIKERIAKEKAEAAEIKEKKKIEAENKAILKAKEKEEALAKFQELRAKNKSKVNKS